MNDRDLRSDPRLDAWKAFLRAHARITRQLERELQQEQQLALADYEVLLQLATSDERRLRMSELADGLLLSRSGATRLVDRLERAGLVARETCQSDRRGQWATITPAGYQRLRAASPTHLRGVAEHFLDRLPDGRHAELAALLEGIVAD